MNSGKQTVILYSLIEWQADSFNDWRNEYLMDWFIAWLMTNVRVSNYPILSETVKNLYKALSSEKSVLLYTHTHTHTYTYIYPIYMYIYLTNSTLIGIKVLAIQCKLL